MAPELVWLSFSNFDRRCCPSGRNRDGALLVLKKDDSNAAFEYEYPDLTGELSSGRGLPLVSDPNGGAPVENKLQRPALPAICTLTY